jgi:hypothetical protein
MVWARQTMNASATLSLSCTTVCGSRFPVKVVNRSPADAVIGTVTLDDLEINAPLPAALFDPAGE